MPTHVLLDEEGTRLFTDSCILLEQVRTIDRERLKEYVGHADEETMQKVDNAIAVSFGLMEKPRAVVASARLWQIKTPYFE